MTVLQASRHFYPPPSHPVPAASCPVHHYLIVVGATDTSYHRQCQEDEVSFHRCSVFLVVVRDTLTPTPNMKAGAAWLVVGLVVCGAGGCAGLHLLVYPSGEWKVPEDTLHNLTVSLRLNQSEVDPALAVPAEAVLEVAALHRDEWRLDWQRRVVQFSPQEAVEGVNKTLTFSGFYWGRTHVGLFLTRNDLNLATQGSIAAGGDLHDTWMDLHAPLRLRNKNNTWDDLQLGANLTLLNHLQVSVLPFPPPLTSPPLCPHTTHTTVTTPSVCIYLLSLTGITYFFPHSHTFLPSHLPSSSKTLPQSCLSSSHLPPLTTPASPHHTCLTSPHLPHLTTPASHHHTCLPSDRGGPLRPRARDALHLLWLHLLAVQQHQHGRAARPERDPGGAATSPRSPLRLHLTVRLHATGEGKQRGNKREGMKRVSDRERNKKDVRDKVKKREE